MTGKLNNKVQGSIYNSSLYTMQPLNVRRDWATIARSSTVAFSPIHGTPAQSMQPPLDTFQNTRLALYPDSLSNYPKYNVSQNPGAKPKNGFLKGMLKGLATALAIGLVGVYVSKNSAKISYMYRNFGKKGIDNFINSATDNSLKTAFDSFSKNSPILEEIDKMGVKNIKNIANALKQKGVKEVVNSCADVKILAKSEDGSYYSMPIFDFKSNNSGFGLYQEIERVKDYCGFAEKVKTKIVDLRMKKPELIPIRTIENNSGIGMLPNTEAIEFSKKDNLWLVNYAVLKDDADKIDLMSCAVDSNALLTLNNKGKGFNDFFFNYGASKFKNIILRFDNFKID